MHAAPFTISNNCNALCVASKDSLAALGCLSDYGGYDRCSSERNLALRLAPHWAQALLDSRPQQSAQTQQTLDRVEVTGSLIRRIEGETALPVITISVEELQKAGVTNAEQAVKFITQAQGGTVTSRSVSQGNGAVAYADLRSLGAQRTLVLLNGKRVVSNPFSSVAVDLNTLPLAAVQRIEVLPDGASATYGTDAIAGVINFITRKDYKGVTIGAEVQIPEESGGEVYTGNLLGGFGDLAKQGWNAYGSFNYRAAKPMSGTERDFSRSAFIPEHGFNALSPTTFPGNYSQTVGRRHHHLEYQSVFAGMLSSDVDQFRADVCAGRTRARHQRVRRRYADVHQSDSRAGSVVGVPARLACAWHEQHGVRRVLSRVQQAHDSWLRRRRKQG